MRLLITDNWGSEAGQTAHNNNINNQMQWQYQSLNLRLKRVMSPISEEPTEAGNRQCDERKGLLGWKEEKAERGEESRPSIEVSDKRGWQARQISSNSAPPSSAETARAETTTIEHQSANQQRPRWPRRCRRSPKSRESARVVAAAAVEMRNV